MSHETLEDTGLLCPWDFPGKNTGVGCHFLLQVSSQPRNQTQKSVSISQKEKNKCHILRHLCGI